ncbi:hypothetical protein [Tenacibaculum sp. UWU-22]|uniref:hypothetical protein n=1 Tax=Tenacibaculum sp. UWU-22 TaxID=3234187 RepID=UPI0034DB2079
MLKYNTTYQSLKKVKAEWHASVAQWEYYWYLFKFNQDGTFIYSRITENEFKSINDWFTYENEHLTKGKFEYDSQGKLKISFKEVSLNACITGQDELLLEGKMDWDMFSPIYL